MSQIKQKLLFEEEELNDDFFFYLDFDLAKTQKELALAGLASPSDLRALGRYPASASMEDDMARERSNRRNRE